MSVYFMYPHAVRPSAMLAEVRGVFQEGSAPLSVRLYEMIKERLPGVERSMGAHELCFTQYDPTPLPELGSLTLTPMAPLTYSGDAIAEGFECVAHYLIDWKGQREMITLFEVLPTFNEDAFLHTCEQITDKNINSFKRFS